MTILFLLSVVPETIGNGGRNKERRSIATSCLKSDGSRILHFYMAFIRGE